MTNRARARPGGGERVKYIALGVAVTAVLAVCTAVGLPVSESFRWVNATLAAFLFVLICIAWRKQRADIDPPRRAMWAGCAAFTLGIAYGRVETAFFTTEYRIGIITFGLGLLIMGFQAMLDDRTERPQAIQ